MKISFCISSNGQKPYITKTAISSLLNIVDNIDYEIFVGGKVDKLKNFYPNKVKYKEYIQEADDGKLAKLRNLTALESTGDVIVFSDDDIVFDANWLDGFLQFDKSNDWDILGNIISGPGGDRYWDRAIKYKTPDGQHIQHLVDYDHPKNDSRLYQTGCFWIIKRSVYNHQKWDDSIGYYAANHGGINEDVEYSTRLQRIGFNIKFNRLSKVWHWDDNYREFSWPTGERSCIKIEGYQPLSYSESFISLVTNLKSQFNIK